MRERKDRRPASDRRKRSIYLPGHTSEEIEREAKRLDRPVSWLIQYVWAKGRNEVAKLDTITQEAPDA